MVDVYDLDGNGTGPLITRQGHLIRNAGDPDPARPVVGGLEARGRAPHRRARDRQQPGLVGLALPTLQTVTVYGGSVTLPFLRYKRTETIQGCSKYSVTVFCDHHEDLETVDGP